jgi:hypothetical protein
MVSSLHIPLSPKYNVVVDEEDWFILNKHQWHVMFTPRIVYAATWVRVSRKFRTHVMMHRLIMNPPVDKHIDHRNHDGLDNRKINLRIATPSQNHGNSRLGRSNRSGYKGVSWNSRNGKWQVFISEYGKNRNLGSFTDQWKAAQAYNAAALEQWGEFAFLNIKKEN